MDTDRQTVHPSSPVERWRAGLLNITRCAPSEVAHRTDLLLQFCANQEASPERIIDECRYGPGRRARLAFYLSSARDSQVSLVLQSFLVHNGINIFGELVCMPSTKDVVVREQGDKWSPSLNRRG